MVDRNQVIFEIENIVNRETLAWNTQDVELLISVIPPDMVWPWPPHTQAHNPMIGLSSGAVMTTIDGRIGGRTCLIHTN